MDTNEGQKKLYKVSALGSPSKAMSPTMLELRPRQEDIDVFIPSVSLSMAIEMNAGDSPRSVDSGQSALTSSTYQSGYKIVAGRPMLNQNAGQDKKPTQSLNLPIKILKGGKNRSIMSVEVSAAASSSVSTSVGSQLSKLEGRLPAELQGYRKRIASEALNKLRESLALSAFLSTQDQPYRKVPNEWDGGDVDDFSVESDPRHFSSGSSLALYPNRKGGFNSISKGVSGNSLWAQPSGNVLSMEQQEQMLEMRRKRQELLDDVANATGLRMSNIDDDAQVDECDSLKIAIYAGSRVAALHRGDVDTRHKASVGLEEQSNSVYNATSNGLDMPYIPSVSQSILSVADSDDPGSGKFILLQRDEQGDYHSIDDSHHRPTFEEDDNDPILSLALSKHSPTVLELPNISLTSKTREKLQQLSKYVVGHTYRKIMVGWNILESRFQKSNLTKSEVVRDATTGIGTPTKFPALTLSNIILILCSSQVRVMHNELGALFEQMECTIEDIDRGRKIAAIRIILGPDQGKGLNPRSLEILNGELTALMSDGPEKLVSMWKMKNVVFPQELNERENAIRQIEEERSLWIRQQLEEKQKRDDLRERVEARRLKLILDFEDALGNIQFPKGPLKPEKLLMMKDLIAYCKKAYETANLTKDATVADENIMMLGLDAFPQLIQDSVANKTTGQVAKLVAKKDGAVSATAVSPGNLTESAAHNHAAQRLGYEGQARLYLQGEPSKVPGGKSGPSVLFFIRQTVSYGKGLDGIAFRTVVEMLQAYATTRISARFRCFSRSWRYSAARIRWRKIFHEIRQRFFISWALYVRHVEDTRNFCWRKVKSWQFYVKRAKLRREHFRINFWPFYVWHRWAAARRTATEKSQFLVFRVLPTYILLRHYRAWKKYFLTEKAMRCAADDCVERWRWRRAKKLLRWYRRWTQRRKMLRHNWYKEGIHTYRHKVLVCKMTPFLIWKSYWHYKRLMQARVKSFSNQYRSALLPTKAPLRPLTLMQKKERCRKQIEDKESKKGKDDGDEFDDDAGKQPSEDEQSDSSSKKKSKKGKGKVKKGKKKEKVVAEEEEDVAAAEIAPKSKKIFTWKMTRLMDPMRGYDIPSDGEDDIRSSTINTRYTSVVAPLPMGPELDFLEKADSFILNKVAVLGARFITVDKLALIECSLRYHRSMHRAFLNLKINARVRRNGRKSTKKISHRLKKQSFLALLAWMLRDPSGGLNLDDQTDAEQVYYAAKGYRMDKMMKWRDMAITIKQVYGRDYDDVEISVPGTITTNKRRKKADAKTELLLPDGTPFVPPNFLEWDRADRLIETEQAERMVIVSREMVKTVAGITQTAQIESDMYNAAESSLNRTIEEVLETENNITNAAIEAEMLYISQFKRHAADNMLTVLCKISREVDVLLMRMEMKKYFRGLRMPMLMKRGMALYNYKKMSNWIRICNRLISISRNAPHYHRSRTMWVMFNRWLKLIEKESLDASPGLINALNRRKELMPKFANLLKTAGFKKIPYTSSKRLYAACSTKRAVFSRWIQEVQESKCFGLMQTKASELFKWRLLQRCFYCLRTFMRTEDTFDMRREYAPFVIFRINADLEQLQKRFIAHRRRSLPFCIKSMNQRTVYYQIRDARKTPSFKSFLLGYRDQVNRRLVREQRILLDAFETRGVQEYVDLPCPDQTDSIMPSLMTRLEARRFFDPHPAVSAEDLLDEDVSVDQLDHDRRPPLPGGFKISKIRVNHSIDMGQPNGMQGIVGWQLVWSADGCQDIEGPKRGRWKGASMKVHELVLSREEFVVGLEYLYEGVAILGLRVKLHFGGFSRWLGDKPTMSTLSVYMSPDLAPEQVFEREYVSPGLDEDTSPAMPRAFIIGFSGLEVQGRLSSMTLVVRKVKMQHIFSYYWVDDALASQLGQGSDVVADASLQLDVSSLPSNINVDAPDFDPKLLEGDSVTNASHYGKIKDDKSDIKLPRIAAAHGMAAADDDRSIGDMSSISHGSKGAPSLNGDHVSFAHGMPDSPGSVASNATQQIRSLSSSEEQFFDVFRMRLMEIKTAESRAEQLARKLWTARQIRGDPVLSKLTTITFIAPLIKWFFAAICKRVVKATPTEDQGEALLEEAKKDLREANRLWRRSVNEAMIAKDFESEPQPWQTKLVLAPTERAIKKEWLAQAKALKTKANSTKMRSFALQDGADRKNKQGKMLLPRMCLSSFICQLYSIKIAAARHKEMLLQTMDFDAIKKALRGEGVRLSELTDIAMDMIRFSLAGRKPQHSDPLALDKLVELELTRYRERAKSSTPSKGPASGREQMDKNSEGSSSSTGGIAMHHPQTLHTVPGTSSSLRLDSTNNGADRRMIQSNSTSALPQSKSLLPIVAGSSDDRSSSLKYMTYKGTGSGSGTSSRKKSGINVPLQVSSTPSLFKMQKNIGLNERKVSMLKSMSTSKL